MSNLDKYLKYKKKYLNSKYLLYGGGYGTVDVSIDSLSIIDLIKNIKEDSLPSIKNKDDEIYIIHQTNCTNLKGPEGLASPIFSQCPKGGWQYYNRNKFRNILVLQNLINVYKSQIVDYQLKLDTVQDTTNESLWYPAIDYTKLQNFIVNLLKHLPPHIATYIKIIVGKTIQKKKIEINKILREHNDFLFILNSILSLLKNINLLSADTDFETLNKLKDILTNINALLKIIAPIEPLIESPVFKKTNKVLFNIVNKSELFFKENDIEELKIEKIADTNKKKSTIEISDLLINKTERQSDENNLESLCNKIDTIILDKSKKTGIEELKEEQNTAIENYLSKSESERIKIDTTYTDTDIKTNVWIYKLKLLQTLKIEEKFNQLIEENKLYFNNIPIPGKIDLMPIEVNGKTKFTLVNFNSQYFPGNYNKDDTPIINPKDGVNQYDHLLKYYKSFPTILDKLYDGNTVFKRNIENPNIRLDWLDTCFKQLKKEIENSSNPIHIYCPLLIGCDMAGGSYREYRKKICNFISSLKDISHKVSITLFYNERNLGDIKTIIETYNEKLKSPDIIQYLKNVPDLKLDLPDQPDINQYIQQYLQIDPNALEMQFKMSIQDIISSKTKDLSNEESFNTLIHNLQSNNDLIDNILKIFTTKDKSIAVNLIDISIRQFIEELLELTSTNSELTSTNSIFNKLYYFKIISSYFERNKLPNIIYKLHSDFLKQLQNIIKYYYEIKFLKFYYINPNP